MAIKIKASTWRNITGAYVKNSTWRPVKQIYVKVVNTWKSVFLSDPPVIVSKPSFRLLSYSGAAATSPQFLDQSLYGKDGSYTNYTGITGRKITYSDTSDGLVRNTIISGDLFTTGAGITTSDRLTVDGKYLFYELTVSNGTDVLDSIEAVSDPMLMIKKQPALSSSFTTALTGQSSPNSVLTFNYILENYYYNRVVGSTSKIRWWRSTNTTASGVMVKEQTISATTTSSDSSTLFGTSTYTVDAINDNNSYIVVEIIGVSSWTTNNGYGGFFPDYQIASYSSGVIQAPYQFSFGNTLHVGSNGYIGLNNGGIAAGLSGSGRNINIWNEDLVQYKLQEYSDSSNYHLYFRAYRYQSPLVRSAINALDYQIKFYTGQPYCDVYLVRKGSSVPAYLDSPGYYKNFVDDLTAGNTSGVLGPFSWTAGSVMRIYFDETTPATTSGISWTTISDAVWKDITNADIDDSFTSVVTSANQQAPTLTAPVLNSVTPGPQGGLVQANFTGGSGPVYQMFWWGTATAPTTAVTPDGERTFSPLEDATGPSSTATQYMYVRSVSTAGETSVGPSSIASAWSNGIPFNMTSTAVSQNTAPTARATNTFSTSTVKYLDSITWSAGTYNNAASVTSVLLYSTNTSNLVSPSGNTLSSFRTANPYTLTTTDPAGTPYVFSVRDTVVGTNGTTYYFFGNQITSANADAVAFSYNTGVGVAGGWSATVVTAQSGASYSIPTTTGYSVNSSNGTVTATGLGSNVSTSITVTKSVPGYNDTTAPASGTSSTVTTYTLDYSANGGSTTPSSQTGAQGASITLAANAGTRSGFTFGGWNIGGTTYAGSASYTFGAANATATAIWNAVFVTPTAPAPSLFFRRFPTNTSSSWEYFCDYPSVSGSVQSITGMQYEIYSANSTSGAKITGGDGTQAYPGAFTYPYTSSRDGTIWAFRIASGSGGRVATTAGRFGRVRVVMLGTNGTTYYGTWTSPLL
jgi:hypothetical protein